MTNSLEFAIKSHRKTFHNVTSFDLNADNIYEFDFSKKNKKLSEVDFSNEKSFCNYVNKELEENKAIAGVGGYAEHRFLYSRSEVFIGEEIRSVHLGIDIWANAGTPVYAPLGGSIHSFKNNRSPGDYGPTIILKHELGGHIFHTLYGHLSTDSISNLKKGQHIYAGDQIATFGEYHENVHWPPHLHFQIIIDMEDKEGDYPGVAGASEKQKFLSNCPNPNWILNVQKLSE